MTAVVRNDSTIAKIKMWILMLVPSYSATLWWYSNKSRIDEIYNCSILFEKVPLSQRKSMVFQSILRSGIIPGGKEEDKARQAVFLTQLIPSVKGPEEEKPHSDCAVPQEAPFETKWKRNPDAVYWQSWPTSRYQEIALAV